MAYGVMGREGKWWRNPIYILSGERSLLRLKENGRESGRKKETVSQITIIKRPLETTMPQASQFSVVHSSLALGWVKPEWQIRHPVPVDLSIGWRLHAYNADQATPYQVYKTTSRSQF